MKNIVQRGLIIQLRQGFVGLAVILMVMVGGAVQSQDIHFSQFSSSPSTLNPASTGVYEGQFRVVYNFKDQWKTIAFPYRTNSFSFDMPFAREFISKGAMAAGISVVADKAGDLNVGTTLINLSYSVNKYLNRENNISVGLQGGFGQRSMKGEQRWNSEYDPNSADGYTDIPVTSTAVQNFSYGDFSGGLLWSYKSNGFKAHAGVALFHLNQPNQSSLGDKTKLPAKLAIHGGATIPIKDNALGVIPQLLVLKQGPQYEANVGALVKFRLQEASRYTGEITETAVYIGGWYRFSDAFILNARLDWMNFALGMSYDINLSKIKVATESRGGFEISLMYVHPFKATRTTATPLM